MTDLRIDDLMIGHVPDVLDLYRAVASVERSGLARTADEISTDYVEDFLRRACHDGVAIGAFLGGRLVGELHAMRLGPRQFDHVLTGLTVAVHPNAQGSGVGSALFAGLFERATAAVPHVSRIELLARSGNVRALQLYRRLGFVDEGRFVGRVMLADGRSEDDIPMARISRAQ